MLMGPGGADFIAEVKAANRRLFVWTVNEENLMRWCLRRHVDGVVTDDPERFRRVCEEWNDHGGDGDGEDKITWRQRFEVLVVVAMIFVFSKLFLLKYRAGVEEFAIDTPKHGDLWTTEP